MKSSIFIPKTINVGFQNRNDTYTKKLAYIIYYDEKGKLRKEKSWESWRDSKIPNEEFDNVPTSGFVLNKKVGDYDSGWNHRMAYCRIYDPRNFEFEITIENLLYILENTNSIKGKGLEGDFVYGWDGKDLILIPTESPDYKEISTYNDLLHNKQSFKGKDLIIGATYRTKGNENLVYIGRFDKYEEETAYVRYKSYGWNSKRKGEWSQDIDDSWTVIGERAHRTVSKGKYYYFYNPNATYSNFLTLKSVGATLISVIDDKCSEDYSEIFDKLERNTMYSPLDEKKYEYFDMSFDKFTEKIPTGFHDYIRFMSSDKVAYEVKVARDKSQNIIDGFSCKTKELGSYYYDEVPEIFPYDKLEERAYYGSINYRKVQKPLTLEMIYDTLKPVYRKCYLANGKFYKEETVW